MRRAIRGTDHFAWYRRYQIRSLRSASRRSVKIRVLTIRGRIPNFFPKVLILIGLIGCSAVLGFLEVGVVVLDFAS